MRLLVVGGGIAGLAAAWEGVQRGAEVVLLEASDRYGGRIRTEHTDGFLLEHGPDAFVAYRPAGIALVTELGLGDELIALQGPRTVHLRARGRLYPLPAGMGLVLPSRLLPFVTTPILGVPDKLRAALDLVLPRRLGAADTSIGAFLRERLGDGIVEKFADPMIGGIYGAGVDELSLDAVLPSLRANERDHRSLLLASLAAGRASRGPARGTGSPFRTLRGGLGGLVEALVAALQTAGAELRTGVSVDRVEVDPTRVVLADGTPLAANAIVLAGGPGAAASQLAGVAPAAAEALAQVPLASTAVVTLAYPAGTLADVGHGWLEAGPAPISGLTVSSAKWPGRAPLGQVLVRAFVPSRLGTGHLGDQELLDQVRVHVESVLRPSAPSTLSRIQRWQGMMPIYTVGHQQRVAAVDVALQHLPVRVAGSALRGVGVPDCIADGRAQVAALIDTGPIDSALRDVPLPKGTR